MLRESVDFFPVGVDTSLSVSHLLFREYRGTDIFHTLTFTCVDADVFGVFVSRCAV